MAEVMKKATRESYGETLKELAEEYKDLVVLDADLAAATKTGIFKKAYPERFFDCRIAEANMMGVAAGLAACGKFPICKYICYVRCRKSLRNRKKFYRLSSPER